jgi:uncharacterized protein (TIGR01244 family)
MDARRYRLACRSARRSPRMIADLCEQGFRTIICNRPDGEEDGQPAFSGSKQQPRRRA